MKRNISHAENPAMSVATLETIQSSAISSGAGLDRVARACPACQSTERVNLPAYSHEEWTTARCSNCGLVYLTEAPRYDALSVDLAWTQQFAKEKARRRKKEPVIAWLDQATRWRLHIGRENEWAYIADRVSSGRVLDVGCGRVDHVPEPFIPYGVEVEEAAAKTCDALMRARGGEVVHAPALYGLEAFPDDFFDGVIMRSYLEHEAEPLAVLERCRQKLKEGGVIYVKVPNFGSVNRSVRGVRWCGFRFPDHLNYFDVRTLAHLARRAGYAFELRNKVTQYTNDNVHAYLTKRSV